MYLRNNSAACPRLWAFRNPPLHCTQHLKRNQASAVCNETRFRQSSPNKFKGWLGNRGFCHPILWGDITLLFQDPAIGHACCATPERGPWFLLGIKFRFDAISNVCKQIIDIAQLPMLGRSSSLLGKNMFANRTFWKRRARRIWWDIPYIQAADDTIITPTVKSRQPPMTSPLKSCPRSHARGITCSGCCLESCITR